MIKENKITNLDNYGLYSSPLARAMETAKLISAGIENEEKSIDTRKEISKIPFLGSLEGNIIRIGTISEISRDAKWYDPQTGLSGDAANISEVASKLLVIKSR